MNWDVRPTVPGWYWWREKKGDCTIRWTAICEITAIGRRLHISESGDLSCFIHQRFKNDVMKYDWWGPLEQPPG